MVPIRGKFVLILIFFAVLCMCMSVFGQTTPKDWVDLGNSLRNQSMYEDAIQAYNKSLELDSQYAFAWSNKAVALIKLSRYDEALYAVKMAIKLDPTADAWDNYGDILSYQGKYDDALRAYYRATQIDPQSEKAWYMEGNMLVLQGKYIDALKAFHYATELNPQDYIAWSYKSEIFYNLGQNTLALYCSDKIIKILNATPQFNDTFIRAAWEMKGFALKNLGRKTEANSAFFKAGYTQDSLNRLNETWGFSGHPGYPRFRSEGSEEINLLRFGQYM